jgi:hypothetical protein
MATTAVKNVIKRADGRQRDRFGNKYGWQRHLGELKRGRDFPLGGVLRLLRSVFGGSTRVV